MFLVIKALREIDPIVIRMTKINMRTINTKISNFPLWKKNYQQIDELNGQARQTILCNKTHAKSKQLKKFSSKQHANRKIPCNLL